MHVTEKLSPIGKLGVKKRTPVCSRRTYPPRNRQSQDHSNDSHKQYKVGSSLSNHVPKRIEKQKSSEFWIKRIITWLIRTRDLESNKTRIGILIQAIQPPNSTPCQKILKRKWSLISVAKLHSLIGVTPKFDVEIKQQMVYPSPAV